ncbi:MAG: copper resistance protein CopC [Anaerolineae bacterium]|nr:copper resistance protein CopC [Anaerolineae bacterium]
MRRSIGFISAIILLTCGLQIASAHANLVRSEPGANTVVDDPPAQLKLWFSETPEPRFSEVKLYDRMGQAVPGIGALQRDAQDDKLLIAALPPLPPGVYTAAWRVLSAVDGHTTGGGFAFVVGRNQVPSGGIRPVSAAAADSSSGPTLPGITIRWLTFLSLALLVGGFAFVPLVFQQATASIQGQKGRSRPAPTQSGSFSQTSGLFKLLIIAWIGAILATIGGAILQAASNAPADSLIDPLVALLITTRYGGLFWARIVLLALVGGLLALRRSRWWRPDWAVRWWWLGVAINLLALLTVSMGSHAAAVDPVLAVLRDWLHLGAMGVWIGGLAALLLALRWLRRDTSAPSARTMAYLVSRFSQVATVALALLALTGFYRVLDEIGDFYNLLDTPYGMTLLVKLALLIPLLALGAANLLLIRRWVTRTAANPAHADAIRPWYDVIRQTIGSEIIFAAAILLVTGTLTSLPPGRDAFGAGLVVRGQADDLRVIANVNPGVVGVNTFTVYLRDSIGRPIVDAEKVALIFTMLEHEMGESEAVAENAGNGRYIAQTGNIAMPGVWRAEVLVRRAGLDDARTALVLPIRASARSAAQGAGSAPVLVDPSRAVIGVLIVISGLVSLAWVRRLSRARRWAGIAVLISGILLIGSGAGVFVTGFSSGSSAGTPAQNPYPADSEAVQRGHLTYVINCAGCHGTTGAGDGLTAAALNPKPANLRVHMAQGHTDGQLFEWISQGIDGTAMPAFEGRLTEQERWEVIHYIRTFATTP